MNWRMFSLCFIAASLLTATAFSQSFLSQYKGSPYHDTRYSGGPQKIPGKVLCAYYDLGGEGVAYHDTDPKNHGSGELNPADGTYLNEFRIHEGVDTSYTKFNRKPDPIDDNPFDKIVPPADPVAWRQWHHWNLASQLFKVRLSKGKNVLTVHILTNGNMNLAYFDFKPVHE